MGDDPRIQFFMRALGGRGKQGASPQAFRLAGLLCWLYGNRGGAVFPSQETLAKDMGLTDRHVRTLIKELEPFGLKVDIRRGPRTGKAASCYSFDGPIVPEAQFRNSQHNSGNPATEFRKSSSNNSGSPVPTNLKNNRKREPTGSDPIDSEAEAAAERGASPPCAPLGSPKDGVPSNPSANGSASPVAKLPRHLQPRMHRMPRPQSKREDEAMEARDSRKRAIYADQNAGRISEAEAERSLAGVERGRSNPLYEVLQQRCRFLGQAASARCRCGKTRGTDELQHGTNDVERAGLETADIDANQQN